MSPPPPPPAKVDRKRKVKEEEQPQPTPPPPAKVERKRQVKEEQEQPPPPLKVERKVKEEEPPPPPPAKVERKVKEEDSTPTPKVNAGGDGSHITLKVQSHTHEHEDLFFRIKRDSKIRRLMDAYCDRQAIVRDGAAFLEAGCCRRLGGEETPDELGLEDGDAILALLHQAGS